MERLDEKSVKFVTDFYTVTYSGDTQFTAYTSSTEDYGCDVPLTTSSGPLHVEVKTKDQSYRDWGINTTGRHLYFGEDIVPPIIINIRTVPQLWTMPTQTDIIESKEKELNKGRRGERKRWFCLNAASGPEFKFDECPKCPKWVKMYNDPNSELVVVFSDGILRFTHNQLLDAQASYGFMYTSATEELERDGKYWQFKVFLDIDKGTFYPCPVPPEVVRKRTWRTVSDKSIPQFI